jgi:hypothetical protein
MGSKDILKSNGFMSWLKNWLDSIEREFFLFLNLEVIHAFAESDYSSLTRFSNPLL